MLSRSSFGLRVSLTAFFIFLSGCSTALLHPRGAFLTEQSYGVPEKNSKAMISHATVVMVSIDGYRADYNALYSPPNLRDLEHSGVAARSLKPVYPSKTFPNHYTLVTGLYPAHHGIVSNEFYDPKLKMAFAMADPVGSKDARWWQGDPLWILAERAGMRTASYMWVGSDAEIKGAHPNSYFQYSAEAPTAERVDKVTAWMALPPEIRPHLILIYFPLVDMAAHRYGTTSNQVRDAIKDVDVQIGRLREALKPYKDANLIVVSDHGMQDVDATKKILIDESPEVAALLPKFKTFGRGPQMQLYLNEGENRKVVGQMKAALDAYSRKEHKPMHVLKEAKEFRALKYGPSPRTGDLVIDPEMPWLVGLKKQPPALTGANHGWSPKPSAMHGIFFAEGPAFKRHAMLSTVDNVNIAPMILKILGLPIPKNLDGHVAAMAGALRRH